MDTSQDLLVIPSTTQALGSDLSYSEKTSASGAIWTFQKDMAYVSGVRRT